MKRATKSSLNSKRKQVEVEIPEWDESIVIKSLMADVALDCQQYLQEGKQKAFIYAMVSNSIIDEDGSLMFTFDEVKELDYSVLDRLALEVMSINNIAPEIVKQARESLKNLKSSSM